VLQDAASSGTVTAPHTAPEGNGLESRAQNGAPCQFEDQPLQRWEKMLYLQHFPSSKSAAQGNMVSAAEVHVSANISNIHPWRYTYPIQASSPVIVLA